MAGPVGSPATTGGPPIIPEPAGEVAAVQPASTPATTTTAAGRRAAPKPDMSPVDQPVQEPIRGKGPSNPDVAPAGNTVETILNKRPDGRGVHRADQQPGPHSQRQAGTSSSFAPNAGAARVDSE